MRGKWLLIALLLGSVVGFAPRAFAQDAGEVVARDVDEDSAASAEESSKSKSKRPGFLSWLMGKPKTEEKSEPRGLPPGSYLDRQRTKRSGSEGVAEAGPNRVAAESQSSSKPSLPPGLPQPPPDRTALAAGAKTGAEVQAPAAIDPPSLKRPDAAPVQRPSDLTASPSASSRRGERRIVGPLEARSVAQRTNPDSENRSANASRGTAVSRPASARRSLDGSSEPSPASPINGESATAGRSESVAGGSQNEPPRVPRRPLPPSRATAEASTGPQARVAARESTPAAAEVAPRRQDQGWSAAAPAESKNVGNIPLTAERPVPEATARSFSVPPSLQSPDTNAAPPSRSPASMTPASPPSPAQAAVSSGSPQSPAATSGAADASQTSPSLRVTARGPADVSVQRPFVYEVLLDNLGPGPASGVLVRAELPAGIQLQTKQATRGNIELSRDGQNTQLIWEIADVPPGANERLQLQMTSAIAQDFDLAMEWALMPLSQSTHVQVQEPRLALEIEGPDQVVYGQTQMYRVRVSNSGNGLAEDVVFTLSPQSATPQSQQLGSIEPGLNRSFEIELTAQNREALEIHGLATGGLNLKTEARKQIAVIASALEATLDGPGQGYQGSDASYRVVLKNNGLAASERVQCTLILPAGIEYAGQDSELRVVGRELRWEIPVLSAGQELTYSIPCQLLETGTQSMAFSCKGSADGHAEVSLATNVEAMADLQLLVIDPPAPATINEEVNYQIQLTNRGNVAATDVNVVAQFSKGIEPQRCAGHVGEIVPGQVLFQPLTRIEPGQTLTLSVVARASEVGNHRFRVEVTAGDSILVAEEATRFVESSAARISRSSSSDRR
jgi:uncharacterized repeat protein (TIGR01451 family)